MLERVWRKGTPAQLRSSPGQDRGRKTSWTEMPGGEGLPASLPGLPPLWMPEAASASAHKPPCPTPPPGHPSWATGRGTPNLRLAITCLMSNSTLIGHKNVQGTRVPGSRLGQTHARYSSPARGPWAAETHCGHTRLGATHDLTDSRP